AATIEALNTRLDEIANQLSGALRQASKLDNLASVEKQLSEMGQQLSRAEAQLQRMTSIEEQLRTLIERFDAAPDVLEEIATKAANEAARQVAEKPVSTASEDRLNAMHRDLVAMSDKARASDERLAGSLQAVHESLKQLVAQVERSGSAPAQPQKPQAPFAERFRAQAEQGLPPLPPFQPTPTTQAGAQGTAAAAAPSDKSLKSRLAGSISDFQESEAAPKFGRGKRPPLDEEAVDLDAREERGKVGPKGKDDFARDDLVAAARRAAQAAAIKAEERAGGKARRATDKIAPGTIPDADAPSKRKRSLLMVSAAILLIISAALLYSRLRSKPEVEATPPGAEETVPGSTGGDEITPLPDNSRHGTTLPGQTQGAPAQGQQAPEADPPARSGADADPGMIEPDPADSATGFNQGIDPSPDDTAPKATSEAGGVTDVAKSSHRQPAEVEETPRPEPASFTPEGIAALPPGVSVSV